MSKLATRLLIGTTVAVIGSIFFFQQPENPEHSESGTSPKPPDISDIGTGDQDSFEIEKYSVQIENDKMTRRKRTSPVVSRQKLPGLQKIDRADVLELPDGTEIRAKLLTGGSNRIVKAVTLGSFKFRGNIFISSGEILIGRAQSSEDRLLIHFSKLVRTNGKSQEISADASDPKDQTIGLKGSEFTRYAGRYATAVGLNFVGGMSEVLQEKTAVGQQAVAAPTARNALLNGASRAAIEMANDTMSGLKNKPPAITIEAGKEIIVIFSQGN